MRARRLTLAALVTAALVAGGMPGSAPASSSGPALVVDAGADQHPISPLIYGLNFADPKLAAAIDLPIDRWGGNTTDTYNWRIGAANTGLDYYFENVADCWNSGHNWCSGMSTNTVLGYRDFIAQDLGVRARTLLTLPLVGYVAKDAPVSQPLTCGYPKSVFSTQDSFDPYDPGCGNGRHAGATLASDPTRDGVAVDPSFYTAWLADLMSRYGSAADGGVAIYELGNEPALWSGTHSDMHPAPETAAELWQKSRDVATAVKAADPTAAVLGFSDWGWPAYFCSGADTPGNGCGPDGCTTSPDCAGHGNMPMAEWLLRQFAGYDASTHARHLDYFDLHYYAQGGTTPDVTRSLWDPTYTDPSWINSQIDLIPRMKHWVASDYPGTKIALSEYNLSVSTNAVTNALIQADTLGIFAREGLDLATRWPLGNDGAVIGDAFRMYRNYDGKHSKFGDTWIRSTSTNQSQLAIYGARRSSDGAWTLLVINKTGSALTSPLTLSRIDGQAQADTWSWTGSGIVHQAPTPIHANAIDATYPPMSMTLYVIAPAPGSVPPGGLPPGGGPPGHPSPPPGQPGLPSEHATITRSRVGHGGTILVWVRVPGRGRLAATARTTVRTGRRRRTVVYGRGSLAVLRAGTIRLVVAPVGGGRALLRRRRKLAVVVTLTFAPSGGRARVLTTRLIVRAGR